MPALSGAALLAKFNETSADRCRYIAKDGENVFKAKIVELFEGKKKKDGANGARIQPTEGPSEGKTLFIPVDRLKGMQGRQPGFSPAKKESPEAESPAPAPKNKDKGKAKAEVKKPQKSAAKDETFDLESAREEMKDISEALTDLAERSAAVYAFFENLEMEGGASPEEEEAEEEEASPAPAPKKEKGKAKPSRSGSKPRHDDDDEE